MNTEMDQKERPREGGSGEVECLFIKTGYNIYKVPLSSINYIEVNGKYSAIHAVQGTHIVGSSLEQLMERLPSSSFIRTHRNFIVPVQMIEYISLSEYVVMLRNKKTIPMSRRYKERLLRQFEVLK
jgi:two-component system response regulator LytT